MNTEITITKENIKQFPMHSHDKWEYMLYISGYGTLKTDSGNFAFAPNTFIAVPPNIRHGSVSNDTFVNMCIHTQKRLFHNANEIVVLNNVSNEIRLLYELITKIYFGTAYKGDTIDHLLFVLENLICEKTTVTNTESAVIKIHDYISENFQDADCNVKDIINNSGYSDDYCRIKFKEKYGVTPHEYLTKLRMDYAMVLLTNYGKALKINEISELCGYHDSLYFSRQFKNFYNSSPKSFIKKE